MKILAIETSCDETGVAVVEAHKTAGGFSFTVLGNALISQAALHAQYGGVYPNLAKREHQKNLPVILEQALRKATPEFAPLAPSDASTAWPVARFPNSGSATLEIDAIAVTQGPGLEPALWTGIEFAKNLAKEWKKPLIPVNHMEGHLISSLVQNGILENIEMPVLALLISGGHTEFVLMREWFEYEIIGETLDDAVGEAFDKVARMLGLPYPGGPEISKLADRARKSEQEFGKRVDWPPRLRGPKERAEQISAKISLPRPMISTNSCDVSFSGLKTAVLYALRGKKLTEDEKAAFAREFEDAVADVFIAKTRRALEQTGANTFVIGGGVAANTFLRETLQALVTKEFPSIVVRLPELSITGDNAIMIGEAALLRALSGLDDTNASDFPAVGNLSL